MQYLQKIKLQIYDINPNEIEQILVRRIEKEKPYCLVKLKGLSLAHLFWVLQSSVPLQIVKNYYEKIQYLQNTQTSWVSNNILVPMMILGIVNKQQADQLRQKAKQLGEDSPKIQDFITDPDIRLQELKLNKHQQIDEKFKQVYSDYIDKYAVCMWCDTSITIEHCYDIEQFDPNKDTQKQNCLLKLFQQDQKNLLFNFQKIDRASKIKQVIILSLLASQQGKICVYSKHLQYIVCELLQQKATCHIIDQKTLKFSQFICQNFNIQIILSETEIQQQFFENMQIFAQIMDFDNININITNKGEYNLILTDEINHKVNIQQLLQNGYVDVTTLNFDTNQNKNNSREIINQAIPIQHKLLDKIPQNIFLINHNLTFEQCLRLKLYIDSNTTIYRIINDPTKGNLIKQSINRQLKQFSALQYQQSIKSLCGGIAASLFIQNPCEQDKQKWQLDDSVQQMIGKQLEAYQKQQIQKIIIVVPDLFYNMFIAFLNVLRQQQDYQFIKFIENVNDKWILALNKLQIKVFTEQMIQQFINENQNIQLLSQYAYYPLFSFRVTEIQFSQFWENNKDTAKIIINSFNNSILTAYQSYKIKFAYKINEEQYNADQTDEISATTDTEVALIDNTKNNFIQLFPGNQYLDIVLNDAWCQILQVQSSQNKKQNVVEISAQQCDKQQSLLYQGPLYYYQFDQNKQNIQLSSTQYTVNAKELLSQREQERVCQEFYYSIKQNIENSGKLSNYLTKTSKNNQQGKNVTYQIYNNYYSNRHNNEDCMAQKIVKGNIIPIQPDSICQECGGSVGKQSQESYHSICSLCGNKLNQSLDQSFRALYQQNDITLFDETCVAENDQQIQVLDFYCHQYFNKMGSGYSDQTIQFFKKISNNFEYEIHQLIKLLEKPLFKQDIAKTLCAASSILWKYTPLLYRSQKIKLYSTEKMLNSIYTDVINILNKRNVDLPIEYCNKYIQNYYNSCQDQSLFQYNQYIQNNPNTFYQKDIFEKQLKQFWNNLLKKSLEKSQQFKDYQLADPALSLVDFDIQLPYKLNVKDQFDQVSRFKQLRIERYQTKNISFCNSLYGILSSDINKEFIKNIPMLPKDKQYNLINFLMGVQYPTVLMQYGNYQHLQQVQDILLSYTPINLSQIDFQPNKLITLNFKPLKPGSKPRIPQPPQVIPTQPPQPKQNVQKMSFVDYLVTKIPQQDQENFMKEIIKYEKQSTYFQDTRVGNIQQIQICPISDPTDFVQTVFKFKININEINPITPQSLIQDIFKYYSECQRIKTAPLKVPQREEFQAIIREIPKHQLPKNMVSEFIIRKFINQSVDQSYSQFVYWKPNSYKKNDILRKESEQKLRELFNLVMITGIFAGSTPIVVFLSSEYKQRNVKDYRIIQAMIDDVLNDNATMLKQLIKPTDEELQRFQSQIVKMRLSTSLTNETDFNIFLTKLFKLSRETHQKQRTDELQEILKQINSQFSSVGQQYRSLLELNQTIGYIEKHFVGANEIEISELVYPVSQFTLLNKETCDIWKTAVFAKMLYLVMFGKKKDQIQNMVSETISELNRKETQRLITLDQITDFIKQVYSQIAHIYSKVCDYLYLTIIKENQQVKIFNEWIHKQKIVEDQGDPKMHIIIKKLKLFQSLKITSIQQIEQSQMFQLLKQYFKQQQIQDNIDCNYILSQTRQLLNDSPNRNKYCIKKVIDMIINQKMTAQQFLPTNDIKISFISDRSRCIQQQLLDQYYILSGQKVKQFDQLQNYGNSSSGSLQYVLTDQQAQALRQLPENSFKFTFDQLKQKLIPILGQQIKSFNREQLGRHLAEYTRQTKKYGDILSRTISFLIKEPDYKLEDRKEQGIKIITELSSQKGEKPTYLLENGRLTQNINTLLNDQEFKKQNLNLFIQLLKIYIDIAYYPSYYNRVNKWDQTLDNESKAQLHIDIQNLQLLLKSLIQNIGDNNIEYFIKLQLCSYMFFGGISMR